MPKRAIGSAKIKQETLPERRSNSAQFALGEGPKVARLKNGVPMQKEHSETGNFDWNHGE